jgi:hypothetical protein
VLTVEENSWNIEIPFDSFSSREGSIPIVRWLRSVDPVQYFPITREIYSSVTWVYFYSGTKIILQIAII